MERPNTLAGMAEEASYLLAKQGKTFEAGLIQAVLSVSDQLDYIKELLTEMESR